MNNINIKKNKIKKWKKSSFLTNYFFSVYFTFVTEDPVKWIKNRFSLDGERYNQFIAKYKQKI